ncbi:MAG: hypothetical protein HOH33_07455 [Verrucomicrobia bacterium]|jgi:hypothetical protein|nr:hypothetical protein [Verrucomicrobiota bacterium]
MKNKITKNCWVFMFSEIGLTEDQMQKWHQIFESQHPESHEDFLRWLGISSGEIAKIRANSKL